MTGQLFADGAKSARLVSGARRRIGADDARAFTPDLYTHLIFEFAGRGPRVYFRDVRKFGKVAWLAPGRSHERLDKLGVDALGASGEVLWRAARKRTAPIKTLLLDQAVLAGVGNIYADEALFLAGVRGTRRANRVERTECDAVVRALQRVMKRSIATGGSSISDYVRPDGSDGGYQNERRVYGRAGEPCPRCGEPIRRIVLGQRSAHYCAACQR
jgi:formamidopyrimidine-DNA glycosylase